MAEELLLGETALLRAIKRAVDDGLGLFTMRDDSEERQGIIDEYSDASLWGRAANTYNTCNSTLPQAETRGASAAEHVEESTCTPRSAPNKPKPTWRGQVPSGPMFIRQIADLLEA